MMSKMPKGAGERLRLLFCDNLSIARGKYIPLSPAGGGSSRFCRSTFGVHYDKDLLPAPGAMMMEGLPDMEARYAAADVRTGWERNTRVAVSDLYDGHGAPLELCGRGALRRAVDAWEKQGLSPKVGIELECFAFTSEEDGTLVPYGTPGAVVYGTGAYTDPLGFTDAIWKRAHELGFEIECLTAEYDAPQFEFTLKFGDALKAVDDIFLFRQMARETALEFGVVLTFMPKPVPEAGGSGLHVNFSFENSEGSNALASGETGGTGNMNELARACVAGLVHHHRGLAGLVAPTSNSYARLQPGCLSGYWKNWGGDHRGVTTRISNEGGAKARIEHRMADASANPYIAVASVLCAARLGVENGYDLPPPESGDCFERTDAKVGVAKDLRGAMDDLESDIALSEAIGKLLVENLVYMKRKEAKKTRDLEGDELRDFYIHFI